MRMIKRVRRGRMMGMLHHGKHHGSSQANRSASMKASSAKMAKKMEAPTTLWGRFLEAYGRDLGCPEATAVPYKFMREK